MTEQAGGQQQLWGLLASLRLSRVMANDRLDALHKFHCECKQDYHLQGDRKFDEPDLLSLREKLRRSPKLKNAAAQYWATVGLEIHEAMTREQYTFVHRRITKALAPELEEDDAAEAAEEDWFDDLAGGDKMTFEKYANGLIGIADLWTGDARSST